MKQNKRIYIIQSSTTQRKIGLAKEKYMKQVAAGVLKTLGTIFKPCFLANSEAILKNNINRLKIITEICLSYHILIRPLD